MSAKQILESQADNPWTIDTVRLILQASLHRGVSAAYNGLFHLLVDEAVDA